MHFLTYNCLKYLNIFNMDILFILTFSDQYDPYDDVKFHETHKISRIP